MLSWWGFVESAVWEQGHITVICLFCRKCSVGVGSYYCYLFVLQKVQCGSRAILLSSVCFVESAVWEQGHITVICLFCRKCSVGVGPYITVICLFCIKCSLVVGPYYCYLFVLQKVQCGSRAIYYCHLFVLQKVQCGSRAVLLSSVCFVESAVWEQGRITVISLFCRKCSVGVGPYYCHLFVLQKVQCGSRAVLLSSVCFVESAVCGSRAVLLLSVCFVESAVWEQGRITVICLFCRKCSVGVGPYYCYLFVLQKVQCGSRAILLLSVCFVESAVWEQGRITVICLFCRKCSVGVGPYYCYLFVLQKVQCGSRAVLLLSVCFVESAVWEQGRITVICLFCRKCSVGVGPYYCYLFVLQKVQCGSRAVLLLSVCFVESAVWEQGHITVICLFCRKCSVGVGPYYCYLFVLQKVQCGSRAVLLLSVCFVESAVWEQGRITVICLFCRKCSVGVGPYYCYLFVLQKVQCGSRAVLLLSVCFVESAVWEQGRITVISLFCRKCSVGVGPYYCYLFVLQKVQCGSRVVLLSSLCFVESAVWEQGCITVISVLQKVQCGSRAVLLLSLCFVESAVWEQGRITVICLFCRKCNVGVGPYYCYLFVLQKVQCGSRAVLLSSLCFVESAVWEQGRITVISLFCRKCSVGVGPYYCHLFVLQKVQCGSRAVLLSSLCFVESAVWEQGRITVISLFCRKCSVGVGQYYCHLFVLQKVQCGSRAILLSSLCFVESAVWEQGRITVISVLQKVQCGSRAVLLLSLCFVESAVQEQGRITVICFVQSAVWEQGRITVISLFCRKCSVGVGPYYCYLFVLQKVQCVSRAVLLLSLCFVESAVQEQGRITVICLFCTKCSVGVGPYYCYLFVLQKVQCGSRAVLLLSLCFVESAVWEQGHITVISLFCRKCSVGVGPYYCHLCFVESAVWEQGRITVISLFCRKCSVGVGPYYCHLFVLQKVQCGSRAVLLLSVCFVESAVWEQGRITVISLFCRKCSVPS